MSKARKNRAAAVRATRAAPSDERVVVENVNGPGGAKAGWWAKTVQLDLEAKGVVAREPVKPLRWHRTRS